MREKLNNNPLVQVAILGVLLLGAGFFLLSSMGGGEEEEAESAGTTEATVKVAGSGETGTATGATPGEAVEGAINAVSASTAAAVPPPPGALAGAAPPPPRDVTAAWEGNRTVALLFVRNSGIDDKLVKASLDRIEALPNVSTFVIPARRIARYAAITQGVSVNRVPALVVLRPKRLAGDIPTASVLYGFQSPESMEQAVIDAGYRGKTLGYHP